MDEEISHKVVEFKETLNGNLEETQTINVNPNNNHMDVTPNCRLNIHYYIDRDKKKELNKQCIYVYFLQIFQIKINIGQKSPFCFW